MVMRQYQAHLRSDMVLSPSSESSRFSFAERCDSGGLAVPLRRVRGNGPAVLGGCVRGPSQRPGKSLQRTPWPAEWCCGVAAEWAPAMSPAPPVGDIALPPVLP